MTEVSKILRDAADLIEKEGWIKESYNIPGSGYCALGAIYEVTQHLLPLPPEDYDEIVCDAVGALAKKINPEVRSSYHRGQIIIWNDNPNTPKGEVLQKLREAAAENE